MHCYELDGVFRLKQTLNLQDEFVINQKNVLIFFDNPPILEKNSLIFFETKSFEPDNSYIEKGKKLRDWPSIISRFQENVNWAEPYFGNEKNKVLLFFFNGAEPRPEFLGKVQNEIWEKYNKYFKAIYYRAEKLTEFSGFLELKKKDELMKKRDEFYLELLIKAGVSTQKILEESKGRDIIVTQEEIEVIEKKIGKKC